MKLPDGPRQIVAGIIGGGAFLALFFGVSLVWWLALLLAVALYFAALLIIRRQRPLEEVQLTARVSAADIRSAADALDQAAGRLDSAAGQAPATDEDAIVIMAQNLREIRDNILEDPDDFRAARSFINVYLPNIVQTVERYVNVASRAKGDKADRVAEMGETIRNFGGVIQRIHDATLENDLRALELEVAVLSDKLDR